MSTQHKSVDAPVFDVANDNVEALDARGAGDWTPRRRKAGRTVSMRLPNDGPTEDQRLAAGVAWYSSARYSGQAANDNQDWPLAKLLRTEGRIDELAMAERYRALYEAANAVTELRGADTAELAVAHRLDIDETTGRLVDKGVRKVRREQDSGANLAPWIPGGLRTDHRHPRPLSKPMPKAWNGDAELLRKLDAQRELQPAQAAIGPLLRAFEAAVVGNDTLEQIGRDHDVGNVTGAKGAGRVLVFLGFQMLGQHWRMAA